MDNNIIRVLIADDEQIIRQGLRNSIDWNALGFCICDEACNGIDTLEKIRIYKPDLVLLDIRMPKMYGTELIQMVRNEGFEGDFIILSGYSDFEYAQTALHYGASYYLTKPIDEEKLTSAILAVKEKINKNHEVKSSMEQYVTKAKESILQELLLYNKTDPNIQYSKLGLSSYIYQLIIYESFTPYYTGFSYSFADLLRTANQGNETFEHIRINNRDIIILKGHNAIEKFNSCLSHYANGTQKGSPLDFIFLTYGPAINSLDQLHDSYNICIKLINRRFFCSENQHVLSFEALPDIQDISTNYIDFDISSSASSDYSRRFVAYLQSFNRRCIDELLTEISYKLYICRHTITQIKYFLIDIFLQVKQRISENFSTLEIPFANNAAIIETLTNKFYLYEIISYFKEQFEMIMNAIGNSSSESVLDDIIYYIKHNYQNSLKLETIASLFGYNSSYLGKLFKEKIGQNFNSYLDHIRIQNATTLLESTTLKIYEISSKVGYKNVDYFQQKFKKIVGMTPTDYRQQPKRT
ncbi:MAG: response regulator [Wujia sp.]